MSNHNISVLLLCVGAFSLGYGWAVSEYRWQRTLLTFSLLLLGVVVKAITDVPLLPGAR